LAFCVDLARGGSQELFGFSYKKETLKINKASPLSAENTQYSCCSDALVMQQAYDCTLIIHSLCSFVVSLVLKTSIVTDKKKNASLKKTVNNSENIYPFSVIEVNCKS